MSRLFNRANTTTAKKTLKIFKDEILKDKKTFIVYATLIPINRLIYLVLLPLTFSLLLQSLITAPHNWQQAGVIIGVAAGLSILSLITSSISFRRMFNHEEHMETVLIEKAIRNLEAHSDQFFANRKVGSLAGDVMKFGHSIVSFFDIIFISLTGIIVNFTFSLLIVAFLSPILLLPLGTLTALIIWRSIAGSKKRSPTRHLRKTLTSKLGGTVADILGNQQIVRFFATEEVEIRRVVSDRKEIEAVAQKEISLIEHEAFLRQAILFTFQIITMIACVWLYMQGDVSIAALIFAITYLGRLAGSLFDISPMIRGIEQVFLDAAEITDIIDETPSVVDTPNAKQLVVKKGQVEFNAVDFAYTDQTDELVLKDVSLSLLPGERVGLAGRSGGGKTTMTKLLLRFADVTGGSVVIDGQNIADVSQQSLRANIAYVPQEAYLFHRSLRDNVAYGRPGADDSEIVSALKRANAWEFVEKMPAGLDTIVGERGVKLSGGQRQRIAIARAILKDAPILVLDEATSALDSESEKLIQEALSKLMKDRTSIVIAHRLSTIAKLDRIIVLDQGRIVEDGPHATLLEQKGIYANLWTHQSGGFIEE
jgi:ATP-binding cassette, subfamily B, bacterial